MKLICIGDSLTFGFGVKPSLRWANLLAEETDMEIVNLGINGETTTGMCSRLQNTVLPEVRELGRNNARIFLMGGSNDIVYTGTDISARSGMGSMIHQMFSIGIVPLIGIPTPILADRAFSAFGDFADFARAEKILETYCVWLKKFCATYGVPIVDFRAEFYSSGMDLILSDGLHPSAAGHRLMADCVKKALEPKGAKK